MRWWLRAFFFFCVASAKTGLASSAFCHREAIGLFSIPVATTKTTTNTTTTTNMTTMNATMVRFRLFRFFLIVAVVQRALTVCANAEETSMRTSIATTTDNLNVYNPSSVPVFESLNVDKNDEAAKSKAQDKISFLMDKRDKNKESDHSIHSLRKNVQNQNENEA